MTGADQTEIYATLEQMKKKLARISDKGNRWPKPESNIVTLHPGPEMSDDEKRGYSGAFNILWPIFEKLESEMILAGIISEPIPLTEEEANAIPF